MVIAGVEGVLRSRGDDWLIIDVGGVSFRIHAPTSTLSKIGSPGVRIYLHTSLQVREDSLTLYGFSSIDELSSFEMLISVSGVGPKVALAVLSSLTAERLAVAISSGDDVILSSVSGVGKKTAARIILELKGKIEHPAVVTISYPQEEVRAALIGLGYSTAEATVACSSFTDSPELTLEDKIRLALQHFAKST